MQEVKVGDRFSHPSRPAVLTVTQIVERCDNHFSYLVLCDCCGLPTFIYDDMLDRAGYRPCEARRDEPKRDKRDDDDIDWIAHQG